MRNLAFLKNKRAVASLAIICWAIATSFTTAYYYNKYKRLKGIKDRLRNVSIKVDLCINYGNGTREWHNSTLLPAGASLFNATTKVAKVEYRVNPEMGIFVTSINNVENSDKENLYWLWFYWNSTAMKWSLGSVSCDSWILHDGDTAMWNYTSSSW